MCSIDLSGVYYCVNVAENSRKYLRFLCDEQLWQFTYLPQGLRCLPRLYTKIIKVAISHLREQNIYTSAYIDDFIVLGPTFLQYRESTFAAT